MPSMLRLGALLGLTVLSAWLAPANDAAAQQRQNPFAGAKSWAYQLKNLTPAQQERIAKSDYDLVVVDYAESSDSQAGQEELPLTRAQVAAMQRKPDGSKRVVIAYLSIGEAENYRYYWKPEWNKKAPTWNGAESKEWKGNFLVKYWEPEWQRIMFGAPGSYVDRILAAGFDGFYIDRADAYYRYGDTKEARDRMTDFVTRLITYIRERQPNAGIMIQNAEELLDRPAFVNAIDAVAKEDLLFGITHREEWNKKGDIDFSHKMLSEAKAKGKKIFVVEYLVKPQNIAAAKDYMTKNDYVLYYGPRGLFEIVDKGAISSTGPVVAVPPAPAKESVVGKAKDKAKALTEKASAKARDLKDKAKALLKKDQPKAVQ